MLPFPGIERYKPPLTWQVAEGWLHWLAGVAAVEVVAATAAAAVVVACAGVNDGGVVAAADYRVHAQRLPCRWKSRRKMK